MSAPPERFEEALENLESRRSDYVIESPNWLEGQSLLSSIEDIKQACIHLNFHGGDAISDSEWFHYFYTAATTDYLEACYLLISHNLYRLSRTHHRYLFEVYLLMRGLNQDEERAAELYREAREQARETLGFMDERPSTATPFNSIVKEQRDEVPEEMRDMLWTHPSWESVHPQSILSLWLDGEYDEDRERSTLNASILLAFLIGTQFLKAFEGTELEDSLHEELQPLFARSRLAMPGVPKVPEGDLAYW